MRINETISAITCVVIFGYLFYDIAIFFRTSFTNLIHSLIVTHAIMTIATTALLIAAIWFVFRASAISSFGEADVKSWLTLSERVLIISSVLVFIGAAGEWPESETWKKRSLYHAAKALLVIGICGELLGDVGVFNSDTRLQEIEGQEISTANTNAANAIERAASLEKEAAQARLEQEQLKSVVQWRQISGDSAKRLHEALDAISASSRGTVVFSYTQNNEEAEYFAYQIGMQFWDKNGWPGSGWNLHLQARSSLALQSWGVRVTGPDNELTRAIRAALKAGGIEFSTDEHPGGFITYGYMAQPSDTVIFVGPRKPPF